MAKEFNKVQIDKNGPIISVLQLKQDSDLAAKKDNLYCPTKGCNAKLEYVGTNNPYVRSKTVKDHISSCPHYKDIVLTTKQNASHTLQGVQLTAQQKYSRLKKLKSNFFPNRKRKSISKKRVKSKTFHSKSSSQNKNKSRVYLSNKNNAPKYNSNVNRRLRILKREVNQITNRDIGRTIQLVGNLTHMKKSSDDTWELTIQQTNDNATLIAKLGRKYFSKELSYKDEHVFDTIKNHSDFPIHIGMLATVKSSNPKSLSVTLSDSILFFLPNHNTLVDYKPGEYAALLQSELNAQNS